MCRQTRGLDEPLWRPRYGHWGKCAAAPSPSGDAILPHLAVEVGAIDPETGGRLGSIPARGLQRLPDRLDFAALDFAAQPHRLLARRAGLEPRAQVLGP